MDRAAYIGYKDGSVQLIDFHKNSSAKSQLYEVDRRSTPTQLPSTDLLRIPQNISSQALCVQVSYDGTMILTGHQDGKLHIWDVARGKYRQQIADFAAPITNLAMLPLTGFFHTEKQPIKLHHVIKPHYGRFANSVEGDNMVPLDYNFTCQLNTNLPLPDTEESDIFQEALTHPSFPSSLIDKALSESYGSQSDTSGDDSTIITDLQNQNSLLSKQLKEANEKLRTKDLQDRKRLQDDEVKTVRKKRRRLKQIQIDEAERKREMREPVEDGDAIMNEETNDDDLSSDTDEVTSSG